MITTSPCSSAPGPAASTVAPPSAALRSSSASCSASSGSLSTIVTEWPSLISTCPIPRPMFLALMIVTFILALLTAPNLTHTRLLISYPGRSGLTPPPMHDAARGLRKTPLLLTSVNNPSGDALCVCEYHVCDSIAVQEARTPCRDSGFTCKRRVTDGARTRDLLLSHNPNSYVRRRSLAFRNPFK